VSGRDPVVDHGQGNYDTHLWTLDRQDAAITPVLVEAKFPIGTAGLNSCICLDAAVKLLVRQDTLGCPVQFRHNALGQQPCRGLEVRVPVLLPAGLHAGAAASMRDSGVGYSSAAVFFFLGGHGSGGGHGPNFGRKSNSQKLICLPGGRSEREVNSDWALRLTLGRWVPTT